MSFFLLQAVLNIISLALVFIGSLKYHFFSTGFYQSEPKPLAVWITMHCGKFWKSWEYQTTWPASWETYMQVRKQELEMHMEQQTGSK